MVKQFFKKKSKRVACSKRYKIEKKVKEHNRKLRKAGKKTGKRAAKRDANIPSSCPFKEDILKEAEARKQRLEEERQQQKERRKKNRQTAMNKKRNLEGLLKDAQKRGTDYEKKSTGSSELGKDFTGGKSVETSLKSYYKEFKKVLQSADVVLEVLDARDPLGSRCAQLEEAVISAGADKRLVLLLNKIDLVPKENVEAWLKYLRNEFPTIAFKACTQSQTSHLSHSKVPLSTASDDLRKTSRCLGAELLMKLLGNYCRNKDIRTSITVGVVGFPNTGKSSVINSLKRCKACNVGAMPGITKSMQVVQLDKHVKLLDSPGIVMAKGSSDAAVILRNCVRIESLDDPVTPVAAILRRCTKQKMMMKYNIADYSDVNEFLSLLASRMGKLRKKGLPDVNNAARTVLQDWNSGKITYYTHPPETHSMATHLSSDIVHQMGQEFNVAALVKDEEETLKTLKKTSATDFVIVSDGPMLGNVVEGNMEEEDSDDDEEMEEEEESEGEDDGEESMEGSEEEQEELQSTTIEDSSSKRSRKASSTLLEQKQKKDVQMTLAGNQQMNKNRKKQFKQMKKDRKRSDVVAGQLSDALTGAMEGLGNENDGDDTYDFSIL